MTSTRRGRSSGRLRLGRTRSDPHFGLCHRTTKSQRSGKWLPRASWGRLNPRDVASALLLCDLRDRHGCKTAAEGTALIAGRVEVVAAPFRQASGVVIHAPSDTRAFYRRHPARAYALGPEIGAGLRS
jgi:hypothetical protein